MLAPLLAKLEAEFPGAARFVLARPAVAPLFSGSPYGCQVLPYSPHDFDSFREILRAGPFDLAYVLGDNRYAWLARAVGARWIVGFEGDRPAWKNWMIDESHRLPTSPMAWADMATDLVVGNPPAPYQNGDWPSPITASPELPHTPYAVLHVGASTSLKLWPAERWRDLAAMLIEHGVTPLWSTGKGEDHLVKEIDPDHQFDRFCGALTLPELWRVLANARLLVCPDTGVAHLGKLTGVPTVTLFGPGAADIYGKGQFWRNASYRGLSKSPFPCRDQKILFRREVAWVRRCGRDKPSCERASSAVKCDSEGSPCMLAISLESVVTTCNELLARPSQITAKAPKS